MPKNIDFIHGGQGAGEVAQRILNNGANDPGQMRPWIGEDGRPRMAVYMGGDRKDPKNFKTVFATNATLRRDEWKQLDDAILPVAESRLRGIQDLTSRGLTYGLGNALGTTILETHDVSDAMEAHVSMDGVTRGKGDRPEFSIKYLPIPIIHVDYEINARVLEASRKMGNPLDTTSAERAARRVAEKVENMLFRSEQYAFGGGTIYSYLNFPHRNTLVIDDWAASGTTGKDIVDMALAAKQKSIDNFHYGPWVMYVPVAYETLLDADYSDNKGSNTIRQRILQIEGIQAVNVNDTLPAGNIVLVQMTSDVVRLVTGMGIQNVQWQTEGQFITKYKVMTIQVPQLRADYNDKCGIVHGAVAG